MIGSERLGQMKDGVIIINTSRGALIDTEALLDGQKSKKIGGAGLDVYEEEEEYYQAFFTREAMQAIAMVTMENIYTFEHVSR